MHFLKFFVGHISTARQKRTMRINCHFSQFLICQLYFDAGKPQHIISRKRYEIQENSLVIAFIGNFGLSCFRRQRQKNEVCNSGNRNVANDVLMGGNKPVLSERNESRKDQYILIISGFLAYQVFKASNNNAVNTIGNLLLKVLSNETFMEDVDTLAFEENDFEKKIRNQMQFSIFLDKKFLLQGTESQKIISKNFLQLRHLRPCPWRP